MITEVVVTYNDDNQIKRIKGESFEGSPLFTFMDERSRKSRKKAFAIKNHWSAFQTPFVICMNGETPVKAFYSETGEDVIESLIKYLKNENRES